MTKGTDTPHVELNFLPSDNGNISAEKGGKKRLKDFLFLTGGFSHKVVLPQHLIIGHIFTVGNRIQFEGQSAINNFLTPFV